MADSPEQEALPAEDLARAYVYALLSRIFYAPPDADLVGILLRASVQSDSGTGNAGEREAGNANDEGMPVSYVEAFLALQRAARSAELYTLRQEYDDMFVGAGKALVTPYTSGYARPNAADRHVVALREQLIGWGLARRDTVFEVEDHVSALCDVMRWLIEGGRSLEVQRAFFDDYVYPGVWPFSENVIANASAPFYRAAAALTRCFLAVEREGFALHATE